LACQSLLMATGSTPKMYSLLEGLGHTVVPLVPSLFTFNIPHSPLEELAGVSVPKVQALIKGTSLEQTGPLLITHWGLSGPAILKLSAWGARELHALDYRFTLKLSWVPDRSRDQVREELASARAANP